MKKIKPWSLEEAGPGLFIGLSVLNYTKYGMPRSGPDIETLAFAYKPFCSFESE
jgi:hypothetical protein